MMQCADCGFGLHWVDDQAVCVACIEQQLEPVETYPTDGAGSNTGTGRVYRVDGGLIEIVHDLDPATGQPTIAINPVPQDG